MNITSLQGFQAFKDSLCEPVRHSYSSTPCAPDACLPVARRLSGPAAVRAGFLQIRIPWTLHTLPGRTAARWLELAAIWPVHLAIPAKTGAALPCTIVLPAGAGHIPLQGGPGAELRGQL